MRVEGIIRNTLKLKEFQICEEEDIWNPFMFVSKGKLMESEGKENTAYMLISTESQMKQIPCKLCELVEQFFSVLPSPFTRNLFLPQKNKTNLFTSCARELLRVSSYEGTEFLITFNKREYKASCELKTRYERIEKNTRLAWAVDWYKSVTTRLR